MSKEAQRCSGRVTLRVRFPSVERSLVCLVAPLRPAKGEFSFRRAVAVESPPPVHPFRSVLSFPPPVPLSLVREARQLVFKVFVVL